jgi:hypothetical protein
MIFITVFILFNLLFLIYMIYMNYMKLKKACKLETSTFKPEDPSGIKEYDYHSFDEYEKRVITLEKSKEDMDGVYNSLFT